MQCARASGVNDKRLAKLKNCRGTSHGKYGVYYHESPSIYNIYIMLLFV